MDLQLELITVVIYRKMIDLRSDTITKPCNKMLDAMLKAKVGDDVYGEDPTVKQLENLVADYFGMDKAMFFPSGTMANQAAIKLHTNPGNQVIAHIKNDGVDAHLAPYMKKEILKMLDYRNDFH